MEHRWSIRKSVPGSVALALPSWEKIQADICDISLGGLAIKSTQGPIPVNTVAMLSFSLEGDGYASHHRVSAQVAHSDSLRTGFLFMEPESASLRELRDMLYQPQRALQASIAG